ncbi:ABC-type metal ion transport system, periplasmic component/surface adhesin [Sanguibacter keddieii DSM 10542]|uniref:ABC-type metal ion transport system, periplasmic component/surface adhesin n=1 Tax=Sanguibacter keddieii (strain ATCC 51767 / DSM 10542 / NCFB 3025 / ST-74) TaxID=446469 RepID=D1BF12_SANKS|nr:ABC-type metal ion transport system, periplasmic component/surface adhesin [Sanguibacter keddieii DSM 10542]
MMLMNIPRSRVPAALAVSALGAALALTGCSSADTPDDGRLQVLASFYPLQFITQEIGGDLVDVTSLTPSGAEPHDLELSPAAARSVGDADLVVYLSDFQPAVDDAIAQREPAHVVDAATSAHLEAHELQGESEDEHGEEHSTDDGHDHGALDPHFWLDPERLADVSEDVVAELSAIDPDNADTYAQRGDDLVASLTELDTTFADGLAQCDSQLLVTSHEAFGYLAERYGLEQVGISGIDPEGEPSPARIKEVSAIIKDRGVTTIYFETLVSPKVTETLAADLGITSAVLDPLESLTDPDGDYRSVMLSNLEALQSGLGCA